MKKLLLIILLLFCFANNQFAQGKLVVIYADPSANTTNYALTTKLYDAIQETDNRMLLYISNANKPLVSNSIYDMKNVVDQLSKIKPTEPNYIFDIDSLNRLLNFESSLSNISQRDFDIRDEIFFFFFFDTQKFIESNLVEKVAEALLLSNRLINKKGLLPSCKVKIYLGNSDAYSNKQMIRQIKEEKGYDIIEY